MKKALAIIPILMLCLSMLIGITPAQAATARVVIEPAYQEFGDSGGATIPPGTQFTLTVKIYDVVNLYGLDLMLQWDTEYFDYVSHAVKIPVETYPEGVLHNPIMPIKNDVDTVAGTYWIAYSSMAPAAPFTGSGTVFTMTFEIIKQPWDYETGTPGVDPIDLLFDFVSTDLADNNATPIPHFVETATVRIWEKAFEMPEYPELKVMPQKVENLPVSSTFDINIWILGVDPYYDIAGFDITLNFDPTLIEATAITEGPYLAGYADSTFQVLNVIDNVAGTATLAVTQLPPRIEFGAPSNGILFTVTFHVIYESTTYPPPGCELTLDSTDIALFPHPEIPSAPYFSKPYSVALDHTIDDGEYIAKFKPLGRMIDLYVCDFPEPFKGIGPNVPSEGYAPQKMVHLKANITYNLNPVQFKPVTFEIRDPQGNLVAIRTAFSDTNGVAIAEYRLPWPCEEWPSMFGIWTVTATVDIYCTIVNDTLQFKVGWPLELVSVVPMKESYAIGEHMAFNVTLTTFMVWEYNATIVLVVYDEVGQPIGHIVITDFTYGFNDPERWCEWATYSVIMECLIVPKWTAVGQGAVFVSVLSDLPSEGGDALGPEASAPVGLEI